MGYLREDLRYFGEEMSKIFDLGERGVPAPAGDATLGITMHW